MRQCLLSKPRFLSTQKLPWTVQIGHAQCGIASLTSAWSSSHGQQHGIATQAPKALDRSNSTRASPSLDAAYVRHLLRTILRECTYLPDSCARQWMRQHVQGRFRRYGIKMWKHRKDPTYEGRIKSKYREARQAIGQLKRANEGERRPLLGVLFMAYGRTGKRRHELMLPLLPTAGGQKLQKLVDGSEKHVAAVERPDTAVSPASMQAPSSPTAKPTAKDVNCGQWAPYAPELTPQLRALLQSQLRDPPPHITRPTLRRLQPRIEELNSWKQPMPVSRVKNQTKQWYAETLEKVHPPLPTDEWYRLHDLASGALSEPPVQRRKSSQSSSGSALELVVVRGQPTAQEALGNRNAHKITQRFMQRMWTQVFSQCPLMHWDTERQTWKVTWGEQALYGMKCGAPIRPFVTKQQTGGNGSSLARPPVGDTTANANAVIRQLHHSADA